MIYPFAQAVHVLEPSMPEKVPAVQEMHVDSLVLDVIWLLLPATHLSQID